ncbi:uncharacterized protein [Dasypus novemcinctus]|uniref:uncharacterized protein isoform X1 n=1 Tax=Dasypus novemcinctus TaxID=9361 RepID=UPI0039C9957C
MPFCAHSKLLSILTRATGVNFCTMHHPCCSRLSLERTCPSLEGQCSALHGAESFPSTGLWWPLPFPSLQPPPNHPPTPLCTAPSDPWKPLCGLCSQQQTFLMGDCMWCVFLCHFRILKLKAREEEESQARLSEVEEKVNTAAKEVQNYKQKIKAMAEKLQAAECSFREQIAPHEKAAHDTWLKAHALERALVQQAREAEYLK